MLLVVISIAAVLSVLAVNTANAGDNIGVPDGTQLWPVNKVKVTKPGAVIDAMDVKGYIYVQADNVTIRRTKVTYSGDYLIRIFPGVTGTVIENVDLYCTGSKGNAIVFGNYTARRVDVHGCKRSYMYDSQNPVTIIESLWNGVRQDKVTGSQPTTPTTAKPTATSPTTLSHRARRRQPQSRRRPHRRPSRHRRRRCRRALEVGTRSSRVRVSATQAALRNTGSVSVNTPGAVIENLNISGGLVIGADNVTVRNVRVEGSSSTALIRINRDVKNTVIEHCEVIVDSGGANGGIGYLGRNTTVRNCEISGFADGIKVESGGLYENNYIHVSKPDASGKHLDGVQASGDSDYTIRNNVIEAPIDVGGNSAVFVQAWNGYENFHVSNVTVANNYLRGGNYVLFLNGGKDSDGSIEASWVHNYRATGNVFARDGYRFGYIRATNCGQTVTEGNSLDNGTALNGPC